MGAVSCVISGLTGLCKVGDCSMGPKSMPVGFKALAVGAKYLPANCEALWVHGGDAE